MEPRNHGDLTLHAPLHALHAPTPFTRTPPIEGGAWGEGGVGEDENPQQHPPEENPMTNPKQNPDETRSEKHRREVNALIASGAGPARSSRFDAPTELIGRPVDLVVEMARRRAREDRPTS